MARARHGKADVCPHRDGGRLTGHRLCSRLPYAPGGPQGVHVRRRRGHREQSERLYHYRRHGCQLLLFFYFWHGTFIIQQIKYC